MSFFTVLRQNQNTNQYIPIQFVMVKLQNSVSKLSQSNILLHATLMFLLELREMLCDLKRNDKTL